MRLMGQCVGQLFFFLMLGHRRLNLQFYSNLAPQDMQSIWVDAVLNQDLNFILAHTIIVLLFILFL